MPRTPSTRSLLSPPRPGGAPGSGRGVDPPPVLGQREGNLPDPAVCAGHLREEIRRLRVDIFLIQKVRRNLAGLGPPSQPTVDAEFQFHRGENKKAAPGQEDRLVRRLEGLLVLLPRPQELGDPHPDESLSLVVGIVVREVEEQGKGLGGVAGPEFRLGPPEDSEGNGSLPGPSLRARRAVRALDRHRFGKRPREGRRLLPERGGGEENQEEEEEDPGRTGCPIRRTRREGRTRFAAQPAAAASQPKISLTFSKKVRDTDPGDSSEIC